MSPHPCIVQATRRVDSELLVATTRRIRAPAGGGMSNPSSCRRRHVESDLVAAARLLAARGSASSHGTAEAAHRGAWRRLPMPPRTSSCRQRLRRAGSGSGDLEDPIVFLVFPSKEPIAFLFSIKGPLCKNNKEENLMSDCLTKQHPSSACFITRRLTNKGQNLS
jgi:hypothetical protein